jgi:hypothetical protein
MLPKNGLLIRAPLSWPRPGRSATPSRFRATFRMACANAAETASRIVEKLAALAGTAALLETGTLERSLYDVHAAGRHITMAPYSYVTGGRIALGLEPGSGRL